jgi:protein tyrosine kinase modulator
MNRREQPEVYDIKFFKGFIRRRKKLFFVVSSSLMTIFLLVAIFYPKTYVSMATFLIEGQVSDEIVKGVPGGFIEERLQAITQQILSHDKLLEIIKEYNLYLDVRNSADEQYAVKEMREDISVRTIKAEDLDQRPSRARNSTVAFTLSFQGKDPVTVQKVASRLALLFAEKNVQAREQMTSQTVTILQKKLTELKEQADLLERKLNDYKVAHAGELPEAIPFNYEQINRMNLQLDELNQRIRNLEERKRYPEAAFGSQSASDPALGATVANDPWTRVSQLRMQLVNLRTRYSDRHPDVIKTKSELRQLETRLGISSEQDENIKKLEELKKRLAELKASKEPKDPEILKLQEEITSLSRDLQKTKNDGTAVDPMERELRRLTQQRADIQKRLGEYQRKSQIAPLVQKEYSRIALEYDNALKQYNETMSKLAEIKLARGLDQTQLGERFTIINEPQVPQTPDKPKRMKIILAGFLLSIFCGLFASFTAENMDHSIRSPEKLQKLTNVPVLTVIPYINLDIENRKSGDGSLLLKMLRKWKKDVPDRLNRMKKSTPGRTN